MARIRSIHPPIASDEAFMSLSMEARLAWILLWMECDDNGVFEWKPIVMKARLFPGDNIDFEKIMGELVAFHRVKSFSSDGKLFGAVRNFRVWQRPQKPNCRYPLPQDIAEYVGERRSKSDTRTRPVQNDDDSGSLIAAQREDGGGMRKDEGGRLNDEGGHQQQLLSDDVAVESQSFTETIFLISGIPQNRSNRHHIEAWAEKYEIDAIENAVHRVTLQRKQKGETPPRTAKYFDEAIAIEQKRLSELAEQFSASQYRAIDP